jgi:hypothetical protein
MAAHRLASTTRWGAALVLLWAPACGAEEDGPGPTPCTHPVTGAPVESCTPPWADGPWLLYRVGLEVGEFTTATPSPIGDQKIVVVRVDPQHFRFVLVAAGELGVSRGRTLPAWIAEEGLLGGANASMYDTDFLSSVFYMKNGSYVNNGSWVSDANAVFATHRKDPGVPEVQIYDRTCQDGATLAPQYDTLVQNWRMIDCDGEATWSASANIYSQVSIGTDGSGRVLFIHCRSPYSVRDLTEELLALPLDLTRLMYTEGGPEASLHVESYGQVIASRMGSYETGFNENDNNNRFWAIPNVIGFLPR